MPSLFKQSSVAVLQERRESAQRQIDSLVEFQAKIDRRIAHLAARNSPTLQDEEAQP